MTLRSAGRSHRSSKNSEASRALYDEAGRKVVAKDAVGKAVSRVVLHQQSLHEEEFEQTIRRHVRITLPYPLGERRPVEGLALGLDRPEGDVANQGH